MMQTLGVNRKPDHILAIWPRSSSNYCKCLFMQDHQEFHFTNLSLIYQPVLVLKNLSFFALKKKNIMINSSKVYYYYYFIYLFLLYCLPDLNGYLHLEPPVVEENSKILIKLLQTWSQFSFAIVEIKKKYKNCQLRNLTNGGASSFNLVLGIGIRCSVTLTKYLL